MKSFMKMRFRFLGKFVSVLTRLKFIIFWDCECPHKVSYFNNHISREQLPGNQVEDDVRIRRQRIPRQISVVSENSEKNKSFGAWFKSIFTMPDEEILDRCGSDALQYLRFQRHIICYLTVTMILSISIILPINFQGINGDTYIVR